MVMTTMSCLNHELTIARKCNGCQTDVIPQRVLPTRNRASKLLVVMERLIRIRRSLRNRSRIRAYLLAKILNRRVQLSVAAGECSVRKIVHLDIRIDPVALYKPFPFRSVHASFSGGGNPVVCQIVVGGKPDLTSPSSDANDLSPRPRAPWNRAAPAVASDLASQGREDKCAPRRTRPPRSSRRRTAPSAAISTLSCGFRRSPP
jgi:hypothetical protein